MAPRYVIRTIDEDWIDLFDPPSRIDDKRSAWQEAKRRVRASPRMQDRRHRPLHRRHPLEERPRHPPAVRGGRGGRHGVPCPGDGPSAARRTCCPPTRKRTTPGPRSTRPSRNRPATSLCCATPRPRTPSSRRRMRTSTARPPHDGDGFRSPSPAQWQVRRSKGKVGRVASRPGYPAEPAKAVSTLRAGIPRASARKLAARSACQESRFVNGDRGTPPDVCPLSHTCSVRQPAKAGPPLR